MSSVDITNNVVIGDGHVASNAQNGIQVAFGASSNSLSGNYVYGNSYSGDPGDGSSAGGILIAGGPAFGACPPVDAPCDYVVGITVRDNTLFANDVGVFVFNADENGNAPSIPTNVVVARNVIYGDLCYNKAFQAGVSDVGNSDRILRNTIYGPGYLKCRERHDDRYHGRHSIRPCASEVAVHRSTRRLPGLRRITTAILEGYPRRSVFAAVETADAAPCWHGSSSR